MAMFPCSLKPLGGPQEYLQNAAEILQLNQLTYVSVQNLIAIGYSSSRLVVTGVLEKNETVSNSVHFTKMCYHGNEMTSYSILHKTE